MQPKTTVVKKKKRMVPARSDPSAQTVKKMVFLGGTQTWRPDDEHKKIHAETAVGGAIKLSVDKFPTTLVTSGASLLYPRFKIKTCYCYTMTLHHV